ncbi:hypothetical protein ACETU7_24180 [Rhodococcus sp. 3Y1]
MPQISQLRRFAVPITGTAMVAGMLLVGTPASAAISTTGFKTACVAGSIIGDVHKVTDNLITVDAPASVQPGETFTYRIQPSGTSYPDKDSGATTTNLSRLKIDYAIPSNATYVSATVVAGTSIGLDNVAPNVLRVNDSGNVDGSGGILRLSGNNQVIGNSPTTSTNSEGGIRVPKSKKNLDGSTNGNGDTWFRLPAVDVTMVAGATGVIQPKVRTAGAAGNLGASENFSTQLARRVSLVHSGLRPGARLARTRTPRLSTLVQVHSRRSALLRLRWMSRPRRHSRFRLLPSRVRRLI